MKSGLPTASITGTTAMNISSSRPASASAVAEVPPPAIMMFLHHGALILSWWTERTSPVTKRMSAPGTSGSTR